MRLARKLFLLAVMALTALALSATAANAQVIVLEEDGAECSDAVLSATGHTVTGGCHVEYEAENHIPLVAYIPGALIVSNCNVHLEAQIGGDGQGYVTAAALTAEVDEPPIPGCTRAPCDELSPNHGRMIPWPLHIEENAAGQESVEAEFCLRTVSSLEGGAQSRCTVHLPIRQDAGHDHEIGASAEYFCEGSPVPPTSIRNVHFINENPAVSTDPNVPSSTEDIELLH